jgi:uncharacterized protein YndB with AHSA1/START domain
MAEAAFGRFVDAETIAYERFFGHPIERVWRAITDPAEVRTWFMPWQADLAAGGGWHVGEGGDGDWAGLVAEIDPPRRLRCQHGGRMIGGEAGYFEYVLEPAPGGTLMVFTQHFPGVVGGLARESDGVAGGWHEIFDRLGEWLDDALIGARLPPTPLAAVVETWAANMVRAGEFDRATADRYVLDLRREEAGSVLNRRYREIEASDACLQEPPRV